MKHHLSSFGSAASDALSWVLGIHHVEGNVVLGKMTTGTTITPDEARMLAKRLNAMADDADEWAASEWNPHRVAPGADLPDTDEVLSEPAESVADRWFANSTLVPNSDAVTTKAPGH